MALWLCTDCSAAYAVGQPACPNCGSTVYLEDHPMPKITVHGGATNATDEPEPEPDTTQLDAPEEEPSPGSSSETSSSKGSSSPKTSASAARSRARTTENPS